MRIKNLYMMTKLENRRLNSKGYENDGSQRSKSRTIHHAINNRLTIMDIKNAILCERFSADLMTRLNMTLSQIKRSKKVRIDAKELGILRMLYILYLE